MGSGYKGYIKTQGAKDRLEIEKIIKKIELDNTKFSSNPIIIIKNQNPKKIFWLERDGNNYSLDFFNNSDKNNYLRNISFTWLIRHVLQTKLIKKFDNRNDVSIKILLFKFKNFYYVVVNNKEGRILDFYPVKENNPVELKKIIKYEIVRNFKSF